MTPRGLRKFPPHARKTSGTQGKYTETPSTCIRIFLNLHLFSGFKNFHVHTYPFSNRICPSTRIRHVSGNIGKQSMRRKAPEVCILLYLVLYMILDFIARIMAASARKSNKNAKSKGETAVLTATTPLCFWFFRCRVDVLQN